MLVFKHDISQTVLFIRKHLFNITYVITTVACLKHISTFCIYNLALIQSMTSPWSYLWSDGWF